MIIGIVGAEAAKFSPTGELRARQLIWDLILAPGVTEVCSGESPLGGIDVWTREQCEVEHVPFTMFPPHKREWSEYRARNLRIAKHSACVHCIVVDKYPANFKGMRFDYCYHCKANDHIKSGGCWTMLKCKQHQLHIVKN